MAPSGRYTIILPVRNGGQYLNTCIASILAQSVSDFELAVLENCSTDGTAEWLASLDDPRIKIYPATEPLSIQDNWARAVEIPKNEFVTLIGSDDVLDPAYLEVMQNLIVQEPDAGLYQAHFRLINEQDDVLRSCTPQPRRQSAVEWVTARLSTNLESFGTGYMMRSADYDAVGGIPPYERLLYADDALWIMMMRRGGKATAPQECFSYRLHTQSTGASAHIDAWIKAINAYLGFWRVLRKEDAALATVFDNHGPNYFFDRYYTYYMSALHAATLANERLDASMRQSIDAAFKSVFPQEAKRLFERQDVGRYETINRTAVLRRMYGAYAFARRKVASARQLLRTQR